MVKGLSEEGKTAAKDQEQRTNIEMRTAVYLDLLGYRLVIPPKMTQMLWPKLIREIARVFLLLLVPDSAHS